VLFGELVVPSLQLSPVQVLLVHLPLLQFWLVEVEEVLPLPSEVQLQLQLLLLQFTPVPLSHSVCLPGEEEVDSGEPDPEVQLPLVQTLEEELPGVPSEDQLQLQLVL
jgi:hypothetical protein